MNAFSIEDFKGRAIIGITEGLLASLNRSQIEAVVAHEAGHIAVGDCLVTTVCSSLGEIYEEILSKVSSALRSYRGRGILFLGLIYIILSLTRLLNSLLRCFISREREFRADAISVRLTRNPLALAEALKLISSSWRGEGSAGEYLDSIFIVSPHFNELYEKEGFISDLFSTHPPIKKRVEVLLSMAHWNEKALEDNLKNFKRVSPVAKSEFLSEEPKLIDNLQIFKDGKWEGPFSIEELKKIDGLLPTQWARISEKEEVFPLIDHPDLKSLFTGGSVQQESFLCPSCKVELQMCHYEGAPLFKCSYCGGTFVEKDLVNRVLIRQDYEPSERIIRLAKVITEEKGKINYTKIDPKSSWVLDCPKCKLKMQRKFFVYSYPVEVDQCLNCSGIWFQKDELEILQCLYQHKNEFL